MKIIVEKAKLVSFLKLVNFNGLIKDVTLVAEGNKIQAQGICSSNALIFNLNLTCDKVEVKDNGKIPIFDIAQFLGILDRFKDKVTVTFNGEKIQIREKRKTASIRCDADVMIDSENRMGSIKLRGDIMEVVGQDLQHDFSKGVSIKVPSEEIQDLTKNTDAISSSDWRFMFNFDSEKLEVESNNFNNDSFKQEVDMASLTVGDDYNKDESTFIFNYGLKEIFNNLKGPVNIKFAASVGMMIRIKSGRIIVSAQQG